MARVDTRHHRSVIDDDKLEWLGYLTHEEVVILNSLMQEAEEFADEDLMRFSQRHIKLSSSRGGKRVELMAKVAMHDEALRNVAERLTAAKEPAVEKGP